MHEKVVGAAYLYRLPLHPARWRLEIRVVPKNQRHGIGTALFKACLQDPAFRRDDEIQVALSAEDGRELAFFTSLGFETLMTTRLGTLRCDDLPKTSTDNGPATITTLAQRPDLRPQLAEVHEHIYRAQHAWSPVGDITEDFRESVFLDPDELVPEAQFLALMENEIAGISSLRAPFSIRSPDLGWIGVTSRVPEAGAPMVHEQLLGACFDFARKNQSNIFVEVDESDRLTLAALQAMGVEWEADWLNLVWKGRSQSFQQDAS